jgi:hypothetical protein
MVKQAGRYRQDAASRVQALVMLVIQLTQLCVNHLHAQLVQLEAHHRGCDVLRGLI